MNSPRMMHHLPVEAYTTQEWFDREQDSIFSNTWRYAGFVEDLTEPGQYLSVQAGLNNLFVVMGKDHQLRAFHNICRHRCTQLIRAVGKAEKALTCPYHDWTYDLEGNLLSVPEEDIEFPNLDKSCLGLKPASVGIWRSMIFVHPDPEAQSLSDWFGAVEPHLGPHDVASLVEYPETATSEEIRANWKIVVENYIDVYHLSHLHSGTLAMYDHSQAEFGFIGPHFAFREPLARHYLENIDQNAPMPLILPKDQLGAWVPMLFPGLGLGESETSWSTFHIIPIAPDLTRVESRTRVKNVGTWEFTKQEWRSGPFWQKHIKGKYEARDAQGEDDPMASGNFMAEDIYACEQQQKSLSSPYFEIGAQAIRGESPVAQHQQIVADYVEGRVEIPVRPTPPPLPKAPHETPPDSTHSLSASCQATVLLNGERHEIDVSRHQTILEAARDANLDPPYSCEAGVCGACKARCVEGSVKMEATMALDPDEIEQGHILTCQSVPTASQVEIHYE